MDAVAVGSILERLSRLHPKTIDLSLGRIERLLARLGNPERALPPVLHVAGTNGKGSVVAMVMACLEAAGQRVHSYTSPHLVRFNERIVVAGEPIADRRLIDVIDRCEAANRGEPITFFEITTAVAFLAFAESPADAVLLETGLGGRLDATNVIARPALTALTPISLDHQHFLGDDLAAIAAEKAAILKPGVPAVVAGQSARAAEVIAAHAEAVGAPMMLEGRDWRAQPRGSGFVYRSAHRHWQLPAPALAGRHQIRNAGVVLACLEQWPALALDRDLIAAGLAATDWPGRLQRLTGALARMLPAGWELWLDGGHNPAAAEALADTIRADWSDRPLHLVLGMMANKDAEGFLSPLAPLVTSVVGIAIPGQPNGASAETMVAAAHGHGIAARAARSLEDGLRALAESSNQPARVLIAGSLYLAGTVLRVGESG